MAIKSPPYAVNEKVIAASHGSSPYRKFPGPLGGFERVIKRGGGAQLYFFLNAFLLFVSCKESQSACVVRPTRHPGSVNSV